MPYKYTVEMICDTLAASLVYHGKEWTKSTPLEYYTKRKDKEYINEKIRQVLEEVYSLVATDGIEETINKKKLKEIYYKHVK